MSRPIKFRAWSNEHNRYCDFVTLDENGRWIGWIKSSGVYLTTADIILEQYIGLKDKNGKDIYEGDIVQIYKHCSPEKDGKPRVVRWNEKDCSYAGIYPNISAWSQHEVIGNIHENLELLGEQK